MRLPGSALPAMLLLLSTAAHRCLAADDAGTIMEENAAFNKDPNFGRHDEHQKTSNGLISKHSVTEFASSVDSNVVVEKPTKMELSCELSSSELKAQPPIEVMWMHGEEKINSTEFAINNTESKWHTWFKFDVSDSSELGNYTCIFKSKLEAKATFHLKVPKVKGGDKPMVSYERDTVVMKCDAAKHKPVEWIWYRSEGDNKVALNDSLMSSKYEITRKHANESKLHIKELSGNDSGLYSCEAVFLVGKSQGKINLNVLSYMVPLKPFLVIVAEVIILVAIILVYEMHNKKKQARSGEDEKEAEQSVHLKSEDTNGVESDTTRQRKV